MLMLVGVRGEVPTVASAVRMDPMDPMDRMDRMDRGVDLLEEIPPVVVGEVTVPTAQVAAILEFSSVGR